MSAPASPTRTNRKASRADLASTRRSAARAITAPAPAATPLTPATIGGGHSRIRGTTEPVIRVNSSSSFEPISWSAPMMSSTSPPEQNPRPVPVITTARTSSRWGSSARRSRRSAYTSKVSALRRSGRSNVIVATPSSTSKRKCFQSSVNGTEPRNGLTGSFERVDAGEGLSQDQRMDLVGALVRVHRLEVVHVPHDRVLERDPVGAEDGPGLPADPQGLVDVVHLAEGDLLGLDPTLVLHPPEVERQQHPLGELHGHLHELALDQLERTDRFAELVARPRVLQGGLE